MELKIQQRSVIRYYCLCNKTNEQIVAKLEKAYHHEGFHLRTVEKWAARFRAGQATVEDETRSGRPAETDLSAAVLAFLEKEPHSSARQISKALCSPRITIDRILHNVLGLRFFVSRWIPHRLSPSQKAQRVEMSRGMIELFESLGPEQRKYLITGDESWIYWDNAFRGMWAENADDVPRNVSHSISSKKTMVSVYFSRRGLVSIEFLLQGQKYNARYFTDTVLPSIERKLLIQRPRLGTRGALLHIDNATPHTAQKSRDAIAALRLRQVPHPPYSPDIAPCDFFLFGYLKDKLSGSTFHSDNEVISAVSFILGQIPKEMFEHVMDGWLEKLNQVIELGGEYPT
jgi:histone-lysine N-methyltransferase SETMAR